MSHIKSSFSIKDLENFSGVKAHTIRIWEKRYGLLHPERTDSNIRVYSTESLKKLLNIVLVNEEGYKISKIANFNNKDFDDILHKIVLGKTNKNHFINQLKIAMLNFDALLFEDAYQKIARILSFSEIFKNYFIPFLEDVGLLWQAGSINLTHEHFISNLIKQRVLLESHHLQLKAIEKREKVFILFLPDNEMHDLGLTYLQYEIVKAGYKSIMLGASVPIESLKPFISNEQEVVFISYFTVKPETQKIDKYLNDFSREVLSKGNSGLYVLGKQIEKISKTLKVPSQVNLFYSLEDVINRLNKRV